MTTKTEKTVEAHPFSALGDALESAAEKFEEGTAVATRSAKNAAKTTRKLFAGGVYNSAYWISYGLVYSTVYLIELFPESNSFRRGLEEGASDAQAKVHAETKKGPPAQVERKSTKTKSTAKSRSAPKQRAEKKPEVDTSATV
jgi:hypothetical protein